MKAFHYEHPQVYLCPLWPLRTCLDMFIYVQTMGLGEPLFGWSRWEGLPNWGSQKGRLSPSRMTGAWGSTGEGGVWS